MAALVPQPPTLLGVAVSGGGDSMALLHLASLWAARVGCRLKVASVDHGLRPEAAAECALVTRAAQEVGATHDVLSWSWDGRGNLQDAARRARQTLLASWARANGIGQITLGHTRDDQAETLLMRLARGSGVDGLAAMAPARDQDGVTWLRPLLGLHRDALRGHLRAIGWDWAEDPSNQDTRFDRVRTRQAIAAFRLNTDRLAETAAQMAAARNVLDWVARQAARALMRQEHGDLVFDPQGLDALHDDTRTRLAAAALCWVGGIPYRPRLAALGDALTAKRATLHGCLVTRGAAELRITREWKAVAHLSALPPGQWDHRWQIDGPAKPGYEIRALGDAGLARTERQTWLLPRDSMRASPGIWQGDRLIAAPLAGLNPEYRAKCRALPPEWPAAGIAH